MPKVADLNALYPTNCEVLLQIRNEYASWYCYLQHGYIRYHNAQTNKKVYEHQLVGTKAFGPIPKGYHVHHKEDPKTNNTPENLEVLSNSEHARLHIRLKRPDYNGKVSVSCVCPICTKSFSVDQTRWKLRENHYCSQECSHIAQHRTEHPTSDELFDLMRTIRNWRAIGQMFSVTDNAVRKWAKNYNLDLSVCDGRRKAAYR